MKKKRWGCILLKLFIVVALLFLFLFRNLVSYILADFFWDNCNCGILQKVSLDVKGTLGFHYDGYEIARDMAFAEPGCAEKDHIEAVDHLYKVWEDHREGILQNIVDLINEKDIKPYNKVLVFQLLEKLTGENFGFPLTYLRNESKASNIDKKQIERGVKKANEWWERRKRNHKRK